MDDKTISIPLDQLVYSFSNLVDQTLSPLKDHHRRTAVIAYHLACQMEIPEQERDHLIFAAAVHDIGAFSFEEHQALSDLNFEYEHLNQHARAGFILMQQFPPFAAIADIIRYHHAYIDRIDLQTRSQIPKEAFILQVADHVAVLTSRSKSTNILNSAAGITKETGTQTGKMFLPEIIEAFLPLAEKESFWFDIEQISLHTLLDEYIQLGRLEIGNDQLIDLANLFRRLIDFRSKFTATHTAGVSAVVTEIAGLYGYSDETIMKMRIAGYLHDIGKLAIPQEILEKPDRLTNDEFNIIKQHTYFTRRFLENLEFFSEISEWASHHHEKLNGHGYPLHFDKSHLPIESRIVAVADIFTALTEDRPYRAGMSLADTIGILEQAVECQELDGQIMGLVRQHQDVINQTRIKAQDEADREYVSFIEKLNQDEPF